MRRPIPLTLLACLTLTVGCQQTPKVYLDKGNELYKIAKYDEAILNYKKAIQKNDRFGEAYYRLALAELKTGDNREAYVSLSSARALLPGRADVRVTLADLLLLAYMGNKSRPANIYQQLTSISDELLSADPNSYNGLRIKANLAWSDGQLKHAEELFQKANQVKPLQPDLVLSWMQVLFKDGQEREGERLGKELLQNRQDAAGIYDLLFQHYRSENRLAEAEDILRTKVKNNPNELNYALQLAAFYASRNERERMSAVLQKLLENPQRYPEAHLRVGDFYGVLHEWPEALRQYEEGARLYPKEKTTYLK